MEKEKHVKTVKFNTCFSDHALEHKACHVNVLIYEHSCKVSLN